MLEFFKNHKIKIAFIGGALVLSSAYGTCSLDPDEGAIKTKVEEKITGKKDTTVEKEKKLEIEPTKKVEEKSEVQPKEEPANKTEEESKEKLEDKKVEQ